MFSKMLKLILLLSIFVGCSIARPSDYNWPKNVVTVPPNCPTGQEWVNGECRDIWRYVLDAMKQVLEADQDVDNLKPQNMITVPSNCRPGQQWINGQCRDVWRTPLLLEKLLSSTLDATRNQSENNKELAVKVVNSLIESADRNVISVPSQCPSGFKPDALGVCRPVFNENI